ncbi:N-acetyltransferase [Hwanghaeella grinnelliae]|uniref:N-acetyltransferase n=1 Tax=Hwanghaeella grinnelliae TaxID=2500179 RepID=A0A437QGW3_9PROT|nr:GNAT family N-acetyltransferase [Hwanghaeella grinnelliae]RVU33795.1 N-acetyltransferase [Hwanghaeella grinnelliae]
MSAMDGANKAEPEPQVEIVLVTGGDDLILLKTLLVEYGEAFDHQLCFDAFEEELASLPHPYLGDDGALFLAKVDGASAGCVALKRISKKKAEMKRLFVREGFRGHALGRRLTEAAADAARERGFAILRVETVPTTMGVAEALYRQLGFEANGKAGNDAIAIYDLAL